MNAHRCFYLSSKQNDFAEFDAEKGQLEMVDIPYVTPANDNLPTRFRLSARCRVLLRRLLAMHSVSLPNDGP
jgi:hypothetical protein